MNDEILFALQGAGLSTILVSLVYLALLPSIPIFGAPALEYERFHRRHRILRAGYTVALLIIIPAVVIGIIVLFPRIQQEIVNSRASCVCLDGSNQPVSRTSDGTYHCPSGVYRCQPENVIVNCLGGKPAWRDAGGNHHCDSK